MAEPDPTKLSSALRERLERDAAEGKLAGITPERLARAAAHPKAAPVIREILEADVESVRVGDPAPDFTLPWLPGRGADRVEGLTLSDHFGQRPVALIFGSYT